MVLDSGEQGTAPRGALWRRLLAQEIAHYLKRRDLAGAAANTPLLLSSQGRPLSTYTIAPTLRRLLRWGGLKPAQGEWRLHSA